MGNLLQTEIPLEAARRSLALDLLQGGFQLLARSFIMSRDMKNTRQIGALEGSAVFGQSFQKSFRLIDESPFSVCSRQGIQTPETVR
jgi:hypothetical protein